MSTGQKYTAWMLRKDGRAIPCVSHIYGDDEDVYETIFAAEWLYKNTLYAETRKLVLTFVAAYGASIEAEGNLYERIVFDTQKQKFIYITNDFLQKIRERKATITLNTRLADLCVCVNYKLNEEFLRVRYGGMYNTEPSCRDLYFRISSMKYNWSKQIHTLVDRFQAVDTISVLYDEESTGKNNYLRTEGGIVVNKCNVGVFRNTGNIIM